MLRKQQCVMCRGKEWRRATDVQKDHMTHVTFFTVVQSVQKDHMTHVTFFTVLQSVQKTSHESCDLFVRSSSVHSSRVAVPYPDA